MFSAWWFIVYSNTVTREHITSVLVLTKEDVVRNKQTKRHFHLYHTGYVFYWVPPCTAIERPDNTHLQAMRCAHDFQFAFCTHCSVLGTITVLIWQCIQAAYYSVCGGGMLGELPCYTNMDHGDTIPQLACASTLFIFMLFTQLKIVICL